MRVDLLVLKFYIDYMIIGMKIYVYLNVNIIFYLIKFILENCMIIFFCYVYIYIYNVLLLIIVFERLVF